MSAYYNAAIYIFLNYLAHSSAIFLKSNAMIPKQIYCSHFAGLESRSLLFSFFFLFVLMPTEFKDTDLFFKGDHLEGQFLKQPHLLEFANYDTQNTETPQIKCSTSHK